MNTVGFDKSDNDALVNLLSEMLPEKAAKNILYINRGRFRKYRQEWLSVNRVLEQKYMGGAKIFSKSIALPEDVSLFATDDDQLIRFIREVLLRLKKKKSGKFTPLFSRTVLFVFADKGLWDSVSNKDRELLIKVC